MVQIPQFVLTAFAGIGFLFLGSLVLSYVQLLLSLFVLPGKNVGVYWNLDLINAE
jgi:17beta-estradiol 17-dehydrogenase / very-long-chain 3-oxoacyl-CoA reductase